MSVPSNLIPTRISEIATAPAPDGASFLVVGVQGGTNYKATFADLLGTVEVPTTRLVSAGTGLTGGGSLASNITLGIAPGGVDSTSLSATGATPGTYGSGSLIPVFTVDAAGRITSVSSVAVGAGGATLADGNYGDVTASGSGSLITINNGVVTGSKLAATLDATGSVVTFSAPAVFFQDSTDTTKLATFDASGLPSGATTTFYLPSASGTLARIQDLPSGSSGSYLVQGGGVLWVQNYDYIVSAATYFIQGVAYSSPQTSVTLDTADPTNDRIDVIVVTNAGAVQVLTGTPATNPEPPDVDAASQLQLTFVLVTAASTEPVVTNTNIYLNNAEWTYADNAATLNGASTNNPYEGTYCIEGTAVAAANQFTLTNGSTIDTGDYDNLTLFIRSKASWPSTKQLTLDWTNSGTLRGSAVALQTGTFGFNSASTGSYQLITIPMTLFGNAGVPVNTLRVRCAGGGSTIGFYIDNIVLQSGTGNSTGSTFDGMRYINAWNSTYTYNPQNVTTLNGFSYVALLANSNSSPTPSNTNWKLLGGDAATNLTTSVDSEVALFSGTGGKTLKRANITGLGKLTSGVLSAATAATDYVAPGAVTTSGLTQSTGKMLGRSTASTGAIEEITVGSGLSLSAGTLSATGTGSVTTTGSPASGNLTKFSGASSITNGDLSGDVTTSGTLVATIANTVVTYAKIQNISATSRILGRKTSGAGSTEECTLSEILDFVGSAAQGDILYRGASTWSRLAAPSDKSLLSLDSTASNPAWVRRYEASGTKEVVSNLTWTNQQTASATDGTGGILFNAPPSGSGMNILRKSAPSAPYSVYLRYYPLANTTNTIQFGIVLRNSTSSRLLYLSNYVTSGPWSLNRGWQRYQNETTFNANIDVAPQWVPTPWMKIDVTSTTATPYFSTNGWDWFAAGTAETLSTYVTATGGSVDQIGFAAQPNSAQAGYLVSVFTTTAPT